MLYDEPHGGSPSLIMSDATTILVDTDLERDDAAAAAMDLYLHLVGDGIIAAHPSGDEEARFRVLDERFVADTGIVAIGLHASGHRWREDGRGGAELVDGGRENGIFCRYDGSFSIRCPECGDRLSPGDDGSEALEEALAVWCDAPDSAYVACPSCATWTPLHLWRSPEHDFAVGHYAITLYGAHLKGLLGQANAHAATALRHRLGDLAGDYTVVFAKA
ncbi:hypothetical protein SAMN02800694_1011 [Luteibacter sp. UNCMF331Sha3.1]|nr:hypothetical protein SAMN02800694_1011 [Luteibacter sp. UNCMF331Sha3.1]